MDIINDPIGAPPEPANSGSVQIAPHVVFLLDESGSMNEHRSTVVSTFNEYVQNVRGTAKTVSLYTFDSSGIREKIFKDDPHRIKQLTENDFKPGSMTPLYDAMGAVMKKFEFDSRPVHFITHTDGLENYSKEWTKGKLDELIAHLSSKSTPWLFTYLMEGIEGRQAMSAFAGHKLGMSDNTRVAAFAAVSSATALYACTLDSNPVNYTSSGKDTDDLDEDPLMTSGGEPLSTTTVSSGGAP